MKKGIIFDLDGTLWDSVATITKAWNDVLLKNALIKSPLNTQKMMSMMGKTLPEFAAALLGDMPQEESLAVLGECCRRELIYIEKEGGELYEGVRETLKSLKKDYTLCIVSNCEDGYIQAFLKYYSLGELIDDFESFGTTGKDKDENILIVKERNGLDEALYVGDTQKDCDCTHAAGLKFIHAAYGFGKVTNPDGVINSFGELEKVVGGVFDLLK